MNSSASIQFPAPKYRKNLPQLGGRMFLTDGGIETTLIFQEGLDLPCFAAFDLLKTEKGRDALRRYFRSHATIARARGIGFVLESATWRASADWGAKLGYSVADLEEANRQAIAMLHELRAEFETPDAPVVISGCIGPRGDGYKVENAMTVPEAAEFHRMQAEIFAATGADLVTAITMTYAEEAIGLVRAARAANMPVVVSFTTETDGRLPSGQSLPDAIGQVERETNRAPAYYMINCAHPTHFAEMLDRGGDWIARVRGVRANASTMSHAELDSATELDAGDINDLAGRYRALCERMPQLNVLGGCCGTDHRHIGAICIACHPVVGRI